MAPGIGGNSLRGWFSGFPEGRSGIALLMLRAALGLALLLDGIAYLPGLPDLSDRLCALLAIAGGVFLIIGFLTPLVAVVVTLGAVGIAFSLFPLCIPGLFDTKTAGVLTVAILLAVMLLGPGAFSIDARLFGRREIILPPRASGAL